jgi:transposase
MLVEVSYFLKLNGKQQKQVNPLKAGKPVLSVNPKFTSQECSACHHVSKSNRDGEKFVCE